MKKAVSLMMAAAMTMGLAACGSSASTDTAASTTEAAESTAGSAAAADGKVYNVGICQLVQHEALDAARSWARATSSLTSRTPPAIPPTALPL